MGLCVSWWGWALTAVAACALCYALGVLVTTILMAVLACSIILITRLSVRGARVCAPIEQLVGAVAEVEVHVAKATQGVPAPGHLPVGGAVRRWLDASILKFGRMNDTPADRRVLRLWLAEEMKKADMRDFDAVRLIPTVVEFMFIPGAEELMAKMVRDSCAASALRAMAGGQTA